MAQYYLPPSTEGMPAFDGIVREDGAWIPNAEGNSDWAEYQEWLQTEGNVAKPYSDMPPPQPPAAPAPAPADTTPPPTTPPPSGSV